MRDEENDVFTFRHVKLEWPKIQPCGDVKAVDLGC